MPMIPLTPEKLMILMFASLFKLCDNRCKIWQALKNSLSGFYKEVGLNNDGGSRGDDKLKFNHGSIDSMDSFYRTQVDEYSTKIKSAYYSSHSTPKRQLNILNEIGFRYWNAKKFTIIYYII